MHSLQSSIAEISLDIKPVLVTNLDGLIFEQFGNRKQFGRIDFVVQVTDGKIYVIPKNIEHADCMIHILGHGEKTIPFQYRYENTAPPTITRIITGASSYEARTGIRHTPQDLMIAHNCALLFAIQEADKCNVQLNNPYLELHRTYQKK
ncbi:hypothetical protein HY483_04040 [Candidatus Woesearchaeota archaeon]|nr:hypothetical protein [Candidatus Woesearchaeota archaeon]